MREAFYLEFDSREGTDRQLFATFRLHLTWAKRLTKGRVVLLADTKTRTVYGKAKVLEVHSGKILSVLKDWAHRSHLEPERPYESPIYSRAADRRFASLLRRYGPHRVSETSNLTAIILKRTA